MSTPHIFKKEPTLVTLEANKTYAWCTCGLSEKNPFCDGAHKTLVTTNNDGETTFPFRSLKVSVAETTEAWLCNCKQTKTPPYCDGSHKLL